MLIDSIHIIISILCVVYCEALIVVHLYNMMAWRDQSNNVIHKVHWYTTLLLSFLEVGLSTWKNGV